MNGLNLEVFLWKRCLLRAEFKRYDRLGRPAPAWVSRLLAGRESFPNWAWLERHRYARMRRAGYRT